MSYAEIPSDQDVVATLEGLGGHASARVLCEKLVLSGHPLKKSQLAIQRAAERGRIRINSDWTLSVPNLQEAAAA